MQLSLCSVVLLLALPFIAHATVQTTYGQIQGSQVSGTNQYLGVPFAAPPVAGLRWQPPASHVGWDGVKQTTQFSAGCPQKCDLPPHECPATTSEDCLYLNVWSPIGATSTSNLPVMLFTPGGRFLVGTAMCTLYDGAVLASSTNTVVVVTNYRLGALGFLFTGEDDIIGNFGLQDQQFALQWIQKNIVQFGGSPDRVTLFGESAGASSVASHLTSPLSHPGQWFQQAISESNPIGLGFTNVKSAAEVGQWFYSALGCSTKACVMAASVADVLAAQKKASSLHFTWQKDLWQLFYPWTPTAGTTLLPHQPLVAMTEGKLAPGANTVPVMSGHNENEGVMFVYQLPDIQDLDWVAYDALLTGLFGVENMLSVKNFYPSASPLTSLSKVATDYLFVCPLRKANRAMSTQPRFVYHFNKTFSDPTAVWGPAYKCCDDYVCHGSELAFVFNCPESPLINKQLGPNGFINFSPVEKYIGDQMSSAWANFAGGKWKSNKAITFTNPLLGQTYQWSQWNQTNQEYNMFWEGYRGTAVPTMTLLSSLDAKCDMFDSIGYNPECVGP